MPVVLILVAQDEADPGLGDFRLRGQFALRPAALGHQPLDVPCEVFGHPAGHRVMVGTGPSTIVLAH